MSKLVEWQRFGMAVFTYFDCSKCEEAVHVKVRDDAHFWSKLAPTVKHVTCKNCYAEIPVRFTPEGIELANEESEAV